MNYAVRQRLVGADPRAVLVGLGVFALAVAPFVLPAFHVYLLAETLVFALFAVAFNLLYGYTGLLSFGHAMFVAVAGYTVAKFVQTVAPALGFGDLFGGASVLATYVGGVVLAVLLATVLAVLVGYLSVQLREIYFAMITLSFSMAIFVLAQRDTLAAVFSALGMEMETFTNGSDGLTFLLGDVNLFGLEFTLVNITDPTVYYFVVLAVFLAAIYALWRVARSPFGLVCRAIRENHERAEAVGIDVTFHSWMTFVISGAFSGLAGAILIPLYTNVNPSYANWTFSADPVIMTVIGGPYSFLGPVVGAFAYEYLRWLITRFPALEAHWQFTFGAILLVVVLFFDNGVSGGLDRLADWFAEAWVRYREDGVAGVAAFAKETVLGWMRTARDALAEWGRRLGARLHGLLPAPVQRRVG